MNQEWRLSISGILKHGAKEFYVLAVAFHDDYDPFSFILDITIEKRKAKVYRKLEPEPVVWTGFCKGWVESELFLEGGFGSIHVFDGSKLTEIAFNITYQSKRLWRCDESNIFFSGGKELVHMTRSANHIIKLLTEERWTTGSVAHDGMLNGIHGLNSDFLVVAGDDGYVAKYEHGKWVVIEDVPTNNRLVSAYCRHANEIYLFGKRGTCYVWDAKDRWHKIPFDDNLFVYSVTGFRGDIYIATLQGSVFQLENGAPRELDSVCADTLKVEDDLLIGWSDNQFTLFDGHQWRSYTIEIDNELAQALDKAADEREEY